MKTFYCYLYCQLFNINLSRVFILLSFKEVMVMKKLLFLVSLLCVTNSYSWSFPPTILTALQDPDFLLKSGHASTARFVAGLQGVTNTHLKDLLYGRTPMHFAAESGSEGTVKNLLNAKYSFDVADNYGNTPLHSAAASGYGGPVVALLKAGARLDVRNLRGDTPLIFSIMSCNATGADALLTKMNDDTKSKENFLKTPGSGGLTPLQQSIYSCTDLMKVLLKHGADPDYVGLTYQTSPSLPNYGVLTFQTSPALQIAAELGIDKATDILLAANANVFLQDFKGQTALHKAAIARHSSIIKKLLAKGGQKLFDIRDKAGKTALDYTDSGAGYNRWDTRWALGKWW